MKFRINSTTEKKNGKAFDDIKNYEKNNKKKYDQRERNLENNRKV